MVGRNVEGGKAANDLSVQLALGRHRPAGKTVDGHQGVPLGVREMRRVRNPVRLMGHQPDVFVADRDPERGDQRIVDGVDEGDLIGPAVLASDLDQELGMALIVTPGGRQRT